MRWGCRYGIVLPVVLALLPVAAIGAQGPLAQIDVSDGPGTQAEVGITVDPSNPGLLVAGANDFVSARMPSYTSTDGGASWTRDAARAPTGRHVEGDPALAVGPAGLEYYAFLTARGYNSARQRPTLVRLFVATRPGPSAPWATGAAPASHTTAGWDDKPAIAVDLGSSSPHYGRVYLSWVRWSGGQAVQVVLNHSDDGGRSWSPPVSVAAPSEQYPFFPSLAVSATGDVYVAWVANLNEIQVSHSTDGGLTFRGEQLVDTAISLPDRPCPRGFALAIAAQPRRCLSPDPSVVVDRSSGPYAGRVYVTYGVAGSSGQEQNVYVAAFDRSLTPLLGGEDQRVQVNPGDAGKPSDQFLPATAVDADTGRLWVCFYDTAGESRRSRATFSCASSADGGTSWTPPVRVASTASDMTQRSASRFEYGDYEGVTAAGGVAHPIWTDSRNLKRLGAEIYTTSIAESDLPHS